MAPQTMKAAVCKESNQPLVIENVPVPKPKGRHLLVRVKAASLCHSDLTIIAGVFPFPLPLIIGHEAVSVVEELGPDAAQYGIEVGDLIGATLWDNMCLTCNDCLDHGPYFCTKMSPKGLRADGYFAEYTLVDAASAVVIEKAGSASKISAAQLAPLFCAGSTVWDALERAKPSVNDTIAVVGAGGLGALAVRYANAMGVKVIALDVRDEQLQALQTEGIVDGVVNTQGLTDAQLIEKVHQLNKGKAVDTAIVTSGVVPAYLNAFRIVKPEGQVIAVGIPHEPVSVNIAQLSNRATRFIGAKVPGKAGAERCLQFTQRKGLWPKINPRKFKLDDINEMIELMRANKIEEGRMVVEFF